MKAPTLILSLFFLMFTAQLFAGGWIQRSNFGAVGRHRATGFSIGTKGYAGLGHYNGTGLNVIYKDWWEFDPATNAWTQKADYIGNNGNGNYGVISFAIGNVGFVGGGQINTSPEFYRFDPIANTWAVAASCPSAPSNLYGFSIGNFGYYISWSTMYKYDPVLDQWTTLPTLPFSVGSWSSAFAIDGIGYVKDYNDLWKYDPATGLWEQKTGFPGTAVSASVSFTHMGKGYIVSGFTGAWSDVVSEVCEYDPVTDSWVLLEEFPGTSRRFAVGFTVGNRAYLGLGTNGTNFSDFWEFTGTIGLEESERLFDIQAFPNPASDHITIAHPLNEDFLLTVTDPLGKIVREEHAYTGEYRLERGTLPAGKYFYTITTQAGNHLTNSFIFQ